MPKEFDDCQRAGGRIRTISGPNKEHGLKQGQYVHICFKPKGGSVRGEVKSKQDKK